METRIKEIRKSKKLSQTDFGKHLGVSRDVVNNIENKRVAPTETLIKLIISEFRVNEKWLRTGEGNPYASVTEHEKLKSFFGDVLDGETVDFRLRLLNALADLTPDEWRVLDKIFTSMKSDSSE